MEKRALAGLFSAALLASTVEGLQAGLTHNPYTAIVARNAFALRPVPVASPGPRTPPAPAVEVWLAGISTVGGAKKVLLQVADKTPGKKTEYLPPLVERDVQGRVEVVSIDADKGAVVIRVDGDERTLTFEKNAPKAVGATPPIRPALPNASVRTAGAVLLPSPNAMAAAQPMPSGRLGVMVGGADNPSTAGLSMPVAPSPKWGGATNRAIPFVPPSPTRILGR